MTSGCVGWRFAVDAYNGKSYSGCVPDEQARQRLVSALDWETTVPEWALGYRFDIVLRGPEETPMDDSPGE